MSDALAPYLSESYRAKAMGGGSDDAVAERLVVAMRGDAALQARARSELNRLQALMSRSPQQCFVSKIQAGFLERAMARLEASRNVEGS